MAAQVKVEKVGDYSVKFTFAAPQTLFLQEIAQKDCRRQEHTRCSCPTHYLKQFHAAYADKADLDKMVADARAEDLGRAVLPRSRTSSTTRIAP